jgi:hypothetical protein
VGGEPGPGHDAEQEASAAQRDNADHVSDVGAAMHDLLRGDGIARLARAGTGDLDQQRLLLSLQRGAGNAAVARLLRQVAPPRVGATADLGGAPRAGRLIVDGAPGPGQLDKDSFMGLVRSAILEVLQGELDGTIFSSAGCPWTEHWVAYYRDRSAQEIEQALLGYAPEARRARSPQEAVQAVADHVRAGIIEWRTTGTVSDGVAVAASSAGPAAAAPPSPSAVATVARRVVAREPDPASALTALGTGRPLGEAERRVASAFAVDLSGVRVHDDSTGAAVAGEAGAHALAVGSHIAFGQGRYMPGTVIGDALLAHELAHVVQQRSPGAPVGQTAGLERDADVSAAGALARVLAGPDVAAVRPGRRSGLAIQRCGDNVYIPPAPAQRSYDEVIADFRKLADHKRAVAAGETNEDPDLLATEPTLVDELHRMGIRLEAVEIMNRLLADPKADLRRVRGHIVQIPGGEIRWGEKVRLQAELDYVPPGRLVEYEWRWKAGAGEEEFQFGQAPNRGSHDKIEISEGFWLTERGGRVGKSKKVQVTCNIYLGKEKTAQTRLDTGEMSIADEQIPAHLKLVAEPAVPLVGGRVRFSVAEWAPQWTVNELIWSVDGKTMGDDTVGFSHAFSTPGSHSIDLHVNKVRRSLGVRERQPAGDGHLDLTVQDPARASTEMLDQMQQPGSGLLPSTKALEASLVTSIAEIERHAAEGGEQKDYWVDRLKMQRKRLAELRENAFELDTAEALPGDPAALTDGHAYNGPIAAVLSMPEGMGVQPLTIHITVHKDGNEWVSRLIDLTSKDVYDREGRGPTPLAAHHGAFQAWINDHPYPRHGTVTYRFPAQGWDVPTTFKTKDTAWDTAVAWLDGIVTVGGYVAAGLLFMAPEATVTKWLGYTILMLSVARSGIAIYENLNSGVGLTDARNVIEGVSILTSFLGLGGSALRQAGIRAIPNPAMFRAGNWVLMTGLALDAGTLVAVTVEGLDELRAVRADPTLDDGQKSAAVVRLIGTLGLRTALFFQANKELFKGGLRMSDFVYTDPRFGGRVNAGDITLSQGSRLDLAVEFHRAGDALGAEAVAKGRIPDSEILDRHGMLPWLSTLPPAEAAALSRRLSTATMAQLQGITAGEALAAARQVGDDALFSQLVSTYGAGRTRAIAQGVGKITATLVGDTARIAQIGQVAALEKTGKVEGLEDWVAQTSARVNTTSSPAARAEQLRDVTALTGELSALQAVAAQEAGNPNTVVRFNRAPASVPGTPTPQSFDIVVTSRTPAAGGAPAAPQRSIEVETIGGPIQGSRDLMSGVAHAGTKLPLARGSGGGVPPLRAGASLPPGSAESGVVVPDGSYTTVFGGGRSRSGNVVEDMLNDLNGRARSDGTRGPASADASGAPYLDRINIVDGSSNRVVVTLVNDPAPTGPGPRHNWRRQ